MQDVNATAAAGNELAAAALAYAARGWPVFPLAGKLPRTEHGFKGASANPERVRAWWKRWPDAGVGIATARCPAWWCSTSTATSAPIRCTSSSACMVSCR